MLQEEYPSLRLQDVSTDTLLNSIRNSDPNAAITRLMVEVVFLRSENEVLRKR